MSEHRPLLNITAVDTQHELKVLILLDGKGLYAELERALQCFAVSGKGKNNLQLSYQNRPPILIPASQEISAIYTDMEYKDGVVVVEIRACYDRDRFRYTTAEARHHDDSDRGTSAKKSETTDT